MRSPPSGSVPLQRPHLCNQCPGCFWLPPPSVHVQCRRHSHICQSCRHGWHELLRSQWHDCSAPRCPAVSAQDSPSPLKLFTCVKLRVISPRSGVTRKVQPSYCPTVLMFSHAIFTTAHPCTSLLSAVQLTSSSSCARISRMCTQRTSSGERIIGPSPVCR